MKIKNIIHQLVNSLPIFSFLLAISLILLPISTELLDLMIGLNMILSLGLIFITFTRSSPLEFTSFPSLLLLATLFRFSLNVSSTRLILSQAEAGLLIEAVGKIVIQDNIFIGIIIFIILGLVQYFIISKGSERIAEVAARFNLDALPGKQMSIDADLRAGIISSLEAKQKRNELQIESKYYGSLDGSMKFIKGDALMGWLLILINLAGGFYVGMIKFNYDFNTASDIYFRLTIGDGLLNQIPSLILGLCSGLLVTRVQSEDESKSLSGDIMGQLFKDPHQILWLSGITFLSGFFPLIPFSLSLIISLILVILYFTIKMSHHQEIKKMIQSHIPKVEVTPSKHHEITLEIGEDIHKELSTKREWANFFTKDYIELTKQLYDKTGVPFPNLHIFLNPKLNQRRIYILNLHGLPVEWGKLYENQKVLVGKQISEEKNDHTAYGTPITILTKENLDQKSYNSPQMLTRHLYRVLSDHRHDFLGIQEVKTLLSTLESKYPDLIYEVIPKLISISQLTELLKRLAQENISIHNLKLIIESLASLDPESKNIIRLTEEIRCCLSKQISFQFSHSFRKINAAYLDIDFEEEVRSRIHTQAHQQFLNFDPERLEYIRKHLFEFLDETPPPFVIITQLDIRRFIKIIIEEKYPFLPILSFQEIDPHFTINALGNFKL